MTRCALLVTDDHRLASAMRRALEDMPSLDLQVARGSCDGLRWAYRHQPRVILVDLGLSAEDGAEVAALFLEDPRLGGPEIVYITDWVTSDESQRIMTNRSGQLILPKPVSSRNLHECLGRCH